MKVVFAVLRNGLGGREGGAASVIKDHAASTAERPTKLQP